MSDVQRMTGTTYVAANSLVSRLVKLNVLSEMTGYARNRRFRYAPYIALFNNTGRALKQGKVETRGNLRHLIHGHQEIQPLFLPLGLVR